MNLPSLIVHTSWAYTRAFTYKVVAFLELAMLLYISISQLADELALIWS